MLEREKARRCDGDSEVIPVHSTASSGMGLSPTFCRYAKEVRQILAKAFMRGCSSDYRLIRSKCRGEVATRQSQESIINDMPPQRLRDIGIQERTFRWGLRSPCINSFTNGHAPSSIRGTSITLARFFNICGRSSNQENNTEIYPIGL
jgi:hypothetical protein